jgi:hypothetical protein
VLLDARAHPAHRQQLLVGEHAGRSLLVGELDAPGSSVRVALEPVALLTDAHFEHVRAILGEHVRVGLDLAAHDDFTQAERTLDHDARPVAAGRIGREHHSRTLGVDHLLHDHGDRGLLLQALALAIRDHALSPHAGPAAHDGGEQLTLTRDVRERLVHPRE